MVPLQFTIDTCPCPPSPSNGYTTSCSSTDPVGSNVYYYCNSGYLLTSGDSPRRCLLGGNWTGSEPVCEKGVCILVYACVHVHVRVCVHVHAYACVCNNYFTLFNSISPYNFHLFFVVIYL